MRYETEAMYEHFYLFIIPVVVKSDMFLFFHYPVFYLQHDVLKQKQLNLTPISCFEQKYSYTVCVCVLPLTYSGLSFLSPPLTATFSSLSMMGSIISSSFSRSSS